MTEPPERVADAQVVEGELVDVDGSAGGAGDVVAAAERGAMFGDRFLAGGDRADLDRAVEHLTVAAAAEHPDAPQWRYWLSWSYALRAEADDEVEPLDQAIVWMRRVYDGPAHPDLVRDGVALDLAALLFQRLVATRAEPGIRSRVDELVDEVSRLYGENRAEAGAGELRMLLGLALEERFAAGDGGGESTGERADLDLAIEHLSAVVDGVPADATGLGWAYRVLVRSLLARHDLGVGVTAVGPAADDPAADGPDLRDLDLAIGYADRGAGRLPVDDPDRISLRMSQSIALNNRLELVDDHLDRDAAIAALRDAVQCLSEPDDVVAFSLADLLHDRGLLYRADEDLAAAALWFGVAANVEPAGEDAWLPVYFAADARRRRAELVDDGEDLAAAVDGYQAALALGMPEPEGVLCGYRDLLLGANDLRQHQLAAGTVSGPELAATAISFAQPAAEAVIERADSGAEEVAPVALLAAFALTEAARLAEDPPELDVIRRLIRIAEPFVDEPYLRQLMAVVRGSAEAFETGYGTDSSTGDSVAAQLTEALRLPDVDDEVSSTLRRMMMYTKYARAQRLGDIGEINESISLLSRARFQAQRDDDRENEKDLEILHAMAVLARDVQAGNLAAAAAAAERALEVLRSREVPDPGDEQLRIFLESIFQLLRIGTGAAFTHAPPAPSAAVRDPVLLLLLHTVRVTALMIRSDPTAVDALGALADMVDGVPKRHRARHLVVGAATMTMTTVLPYLRDRAAFLDRTVSWAEEAAAAPGGPGTPGATLVTGALARLYRMRAGDDGLDRVRSREIGLRAVAGRTWQVLLQNDLELALEAARGAVDDALLVAGWCLEDAAQAPHEPEKQHVLDQAVGVLEAGRGLVLQAATAAGRLYGLLVARGERELADRWRSDARPTGTSPDEVPLEVAEHSVVRSQVITELAGATAVGAAGPLAPATAAEIGSALRRGGQDRLVYLVGATGRAGGYAVVVDAAGAVTHLPLPGLSADAGALAWYQQAYTGSRLGATGDLAVWNGALRQVCLWAWTAAMGPLLAAIGTDRPHRLVLVPVGPLGAVPWHAACRLVDGGRRRYAAHDAIISYISSGRLWTTVVERAPVLAGRALIIGDPAGDLDAGSAEAVAIHRDFYPDGAYLGRPAGRGAGPGTPTEVLEWLSAPGAPPCPVLHAATHALVDVEHPTRSFLDLAGGGLAAGDVIRATSRAGRQLGTVLLAACTTSVAGAAYDEALSLATAFLVAGARSVVGSLWAVPSASTGLLMYMFHHFRRDSPDDPADALRQAQLWMLDPDRSYRFLPSDLLAGVPLDRLAEPYRWAGFSLTGR